MGRKYSPSADMTMVSMDAKKLRNSIRGFLPNIGLSMIDYGRMAEVDYFYIQCQNHRDYYKDGSGRTKPVPGFHRRDKQSLINPNLTAMYVMQDIRYMIEPKPVVYPLARDGRTKKDNYKIDLTGRYDLTSCMKYKR